MFDRTVNKSLYSSTGICCTPVEHHFKVIDVLLLSVNNEVTSKDIARSLESSHKNINNWTIKFANGLLET